MKINKNFIAASIALILLLAGSGAWLMAKSRIDLPVTSFQKMSKPLPEIDLLSVGEEEYALPDTAFLLVVWATWCPTCVAEHSYLSEVAEDIPLVGILLRDEEAQASQFLLENGNPFEHNFNDAVGSYSEKIDVLGTPSMFFIDDNKIIRARLIGGLDERKWQGKKLREFTANL